jgi:hypothetical protein
VQSFVSSSLRFIKSFCLGRIIFLVRLKFFYALLSDRLIQVGQQWFCSTVYRAHFFGMLTK